MRKLIAGLLMALLIATPVSAAPSAPTGTISVNYDLTGVPTYQQPVYFDWSVSGKLKGYQYPMIYVECFQPDNPYKYTELGDLVYGMLERPYASPFEAYRLGGGSSAWVSWVNAGGETAAHCVAHIMIYPGLHSGPILDLNTVEFDAK